MSAPNPTLSLAAIGVALGLGLLAGGPAAAQAPASGDTGGGITRVPKPVTGAQVYEYVCQSCHMADAKGATGAASFPALAANPRLGVAVYPVTMVAKGKGAMPGFADSLSPAQIAEVVTYVRTHFGNSFEKPVTEADVLRIAGPPPHKSEGH